MTRTRICVYNNQHRTDARATRARPGLQARSKTMTDISDISKLTASMTPEQRVRFAILCARQVYTEPDWTRWANAWLDGTDRTYESADAAYNVAHADAEQQPDYNSIGAWSARTNRAAAAHCASLSAERLAASANGTPYSNTPWAAGAAKGDAAETRWTCCAAVGYAADADSTLDLVALVNAACS